MSARANVVFAWGNLVDLNQTITYSSQATLSPIAYMAQDFRSVRGQFAGCTSEYIVVTFAAGAQTFDSLGIVNCNMTAAGTVELHGSTDGFVLSDDVIVPPSNLQSNKKTFVINSVSLFVGEAVQSYTSVKILFKDPTNPAGFINCARVFVGQSFIPQYNYGWDWSPAYEDLSEETITQNKASHFNAKVIRAIPDLPFVKMTESDLETLEGLFLTNGKRIPFFLSLDPDNRPDRTYWCTLQAIPKPQQKSFASYDFTVNFKEYI